MITYKAHYKDEFHDLDIDISHDTGRALTFTIDGVRFKGANFNDFELEEPEKYSMDDLPFRLFKEGGKIYHEKLGIELDSEYFYTLQRYSLEVTIPVTVIRISDSRNMDAFIRLKVKLRERNENDRNNIIYHRCDGVRVFPDVSDVEDFSLHIGDEIINGQKTLYFEDALKSINSQIKDIYDLKCCLTCQYSDYSPYGNDGFGYMLCYRNHRDEYLKVNDKDSFLSMLRILTLNLNMKQTCAKNLPPASFVRDTGGMYNNYIILCAALRCGVFYHLQSLNTPASFDFTFSPFCL